MDFEMKANPTYYDPDTMTVGTVTESGEELWFNSIDGTVSRVVDEDEMLVPSIFITQFVQGLQRSGNIPTITDQLSGNVPATFGQRFDIIPTESRQRADLSEARSGKRPPLTPRQLCEKYKDVVGILKDAKTIKRLSAGVYGSYKDLPKNTPEYIVNYINNQGLRRSDGKAFTVDTVSPIVASMKICNRPTKTRVIFLIVFAVLMSVGVTRVWQYFTAPIELTTEQTNQNQNKNQIFTVTDVDLICKQNKIQLTEFRIKLIVAKSYADRDELAAEVLRQHGEMIKAMEK